MYYQPPHCTFWHGGALGAVQLSVSPLQFIARSSLGRKCSLFTGNAGQGPEDQAEHKLRLLQLTASLVRLGAVRGCATCLRPKDAVFCFHACPAFTVALFFLVV